MSPSHSQTSAYHDKPRASSSSLSKAGSSTASAHLLPSSIIPKKVSSKSKRDQTVTSHHAKKARAAASDSDSEYSAEGQPARKLSSTSTRPPAPPFIPSSDSDDPSSSSSDSDLTAASVEIPVARVKIKQEPVRLSDRKDTNIQSTAVRQLSKKAPSAKPAPAVPPSILTSLSDAPSVRQFVKEFVQYHQAGGNQHPSLFVKKSTLFQAAMMQKRNISEFEHDCPMEFIAWLEAKHDQGDTKTVSRNFRALSSIFTDPHNITIEQLQEYSYSASQLVAHNTPWRTAHKLFIEGIPSSMLRDTLSEREAVSTEEQWNQLMHDFAEQLDDIETTTQRNKQFDLTTVNKSAKPLPTSPSGKASTVRNNSNSNYGNYNGSNYNNRGQSSSNPRNYSTSSNTAHNSQTTSSYQPNTPRVQIAPTPTTIPVTNPAIPTTAANPRGVDNNAAWFARQVHTVSSISTLIPRPYLDMSCTPLGTSTPIRTFKALKDTGADISCIRAEFANKLLSKGFTSSKSSSSISMIMANSAHTNVLTGSYIPVNLIHFSRNIEVFLWICTSLSENVILGYSDLGRTGYLDMQEKFDRKSGVVSTIRKYSLPPDSTTPSPIKLNPNLTEEYVQPTDLVTIIGKSTITTSKNPGQKSTRISENNIKKNSLHPSRTQPQSTAVEATLPSPAILIVPTPTTPVRYSDEIDSESDDESMPRLNECYSSDEEDDFDMEADNNDSPNDVDLNKPVVSTLKINDMTKEDLDLLLADFQQLDQQSPAHIATSLPVPSTSNAAVETPAAQRTSSLPAFTIPEPDTVATNSKTHSSKMLPEGCEKFRLRQIMCHSCLKLFDFSISRQEHHARKGFPEPHRCYTCTVVSKDNCRNIASYVLSNKEKQENNIAKAAYNLNCLQLSEVRRNEELVSNFTKHNIDPSELASWYQVDTPETTPWCDDREVFPTDMSEDEKIILPTINEVCDPNGRIAELCKKYEKRFDNDIRAGADIEAELILIPKEGATPQFATKRRFHPTHNKVIDETVQGFYDNGVVEQCEDSEWLSNPLVVVQPTKNRMCLDYKKVNNQLEKHRSLIPNPDDLFAFTKGKKFLAKLDLTSGYHQFRMHKDSRKYTAFQTNTGIHQFVRVPFGLHTAPGFFANIMRKVLDGCTGAMGYFDDILVVADSSEELEEKLEEIFKQLERYNIKIKGKKCEIGNSSIEFLGMIVSGEGITIKDARKEVIQDWVFPKTVKQVSQFLGFVGFVTKFLPNASTTLAPFTNLTKGKRSKKNRNDQIPDTPENRAAFEAVKVAVSEAGLLYHPDYSLPMYLKTDASKVGIGGYLFQMVDDEERPLAFYSSKLNEQALKWSIYEKEAFGVYMSIIHFQQHLKGSPFHLLTDHANLQYIKENSAPKVVRWFLRLQEYQFKLHHIPRTQNIVADSLAGAADSATVSCGVIHIWHDAPALSDRIHNMIKAVHNSLDGHLGAKKTMSKLNKKYSDHGITLKDVSQYIRECAVCQKLENIGSQKGVGRIVKLSDAVPWRSVAMDYLHIGDPTAVDCPNAVLVFIDQCTRKVALYATHGESSRQAAEKLIDLFGREGPIKYLKSDNASHFINHTINQFNMLTNTNHLKSIPNRSQSNGIVERANKEVLRHLRALMIDNDVALGEWHILLPLVQRILNSTKSEVTGYTPDEMESGRTKDLNARVLAPITETDGVKTVDLTVEMRMLHDSQQEIVRRSLLYQSKNAKPPVKEVETTQFPIDAPVLIRYKHNKSPNKLCTPWEGPYIVLSQEGSIVRVRNCGTNAEDSRHVSEIKRFLCSKKISPEKLAAIAMKDTGEYFVDRILSHTGDIHRHKNSVKLLVKWMGYSDEEATWEDWKELKKCAATDKYLAEIKLAKSNKKKDANNIPVILPTIISIEDNDIELKTVIEDNDIELKSVTEDNDIELKTVTEDDIEEELNVTEEILIPLIPTPSSKISVPKSVDKKVLDLSRYKSAKVSHGRDDANQRNTRSKPMWK